jgi:hypothetical protein
MFTLLGSAGRISDHADVGSKAAVAHLLSGEWHLDAVDVHEPATLQEALTRSGAA